MTVVCAIMIAAALAMVVLAVTQALSSTEDDWK